MSESRLIHAMGNIDDRYILEALPIEYVKNQKKKLLRIFQKRTSAAAAVIVLLLAGTTVAYAFFNLTNRTEVNQKQLPKIGEMYCVESCDLSGINEGVVYPDYLEVVDEVGLDLLDSTLSEENPYMQVTVQTDKQDYAIINVENYILGDTSDYKLVEDVNRYNCTSGEKYHSSIALEVDVILSQEQLENGIDQEYLGAYEYIESYVSEKGYQVNLVQDTIDSPLDGFVSQKIAIFVADGIKYTLSGRVSVEEMKLIVDSMSY